MLTSFFVNYDIILCPISCNPAFLQGFEPEELQKKTLSYTSTYNLTGWPVAIVRTGTSSNQLPLGIQIVGKPWQEHKVLAVAKFLEESFGGFQPPKI